MAESSRFDVVILGGGLAGLTLARQLGQERPGVRVFVIEKRAHPHLTGGPAWPVPPSPETA